MGETKIVNQGRTLVLFDGTLTGSGTTSVDFVVHSDTLLLSVYVRDIPSGTLTVSCDTFTVTGEDNTVIAFPVITAPSTELLLRKAAVTLSNCRLDLAHTADVEVQIVAKGIATGDLNVKIAGASAAKASSKSLTGTSPVLLVGASLNDRSGIVVKNFNTSGTFYVGFSIAGTTVANGYPLAPGEALAVDLSAGQEIYVVKGAAPATLDIRLIEAAS
jgi:hypothetical protein